MYKFLLFFCLVIFTFTLPALAQRKQADNDPVSKPVKSLVQNIRFNKDAQVLNFLDGESQARFLLGGYFDKTTPAQLQEFIRLFPLLLAKIAFPRVRENFKNLDSIIYEPAQLQGSKATAASTIFIKHPLKTQEMKLKYSLVKVKNGWKVFDVAVLGSSMLEDIRDSQIQPELKSGGLDGLLNKMRSEASSLK